MVEYRWRELYRAAVLEVEQDKLEARVKAAELAIRARCALEGQVSSEERAAMQDALDALGVLERERVGPPPAKNDASQELSPR